MPGQSNFISWDDRLETSDAEPLRELLSTIESSSLKTEVKRSFRNTGSRGLRAARRGIRRAGQAAGGDTQELLDSTAHHLHLEQSSPADELERRRNVNRTLRNAEVRAEIRRWLALSAGISYESGKYTTLQYRQITLRAAEELGLQGCESLSSGELESEVLRAFADQLQDMLQRQWEALSESDRQEMAQRMQEYYDELDQDQQAALREFVGTDQFTSTTMHSLVASGALSAALIGGVQVAGFGAYLALSGLIYSLSSLFGITLPFAVYTGASSTLAALSGGLVLIPAALVTVWQYRRKDRQNRRRFLPYVIVSLMQVTNPPQHQHYRLWACDHCGETLGGTSREGLTREIAVHFATTHYQ